MCISKLRYMRSEKTKNNCVDFTKVFADFQKKNQDMWIFAKNQRTSAYFYPNKKLDIWEVHTARGLAVPFFSSP